MYACYDNSSPVYRQTNKGFPLSIHVPLHSRSQHSFQLVEVDMTIAAKSRPQTELNKVAQIILSKLLRS